MYVIIIAFAVIFLFILIAAGAIRDDRTETGSFYKPPELRAGKRGEAVAAQLFRSVMTDDDRLFRNVCIEFEGRRAELDCVIVNRYGVFIIEVKAYTGRLVGSEDDFEWRKYKTTPAGNIYEKTVRNPVKQVKRQVYLFARYLESSGARVWIKGFALLIYGNSQISSDHILNGAADVDRAIHTKDRHLLTEKEIDAVCSLLTA